MEPRFLQIVRIWTAEHDPLKVHAACYVLRLQLLAARAFASIREASLAVLCSEATDASGRHFCCNSRLCGTLYSWTSIVF